VPAALGPWSKAAQTFICWSRLGVWELMMALAKKDRVSLAMDFLDGTNIRTHQEAAGALRKRRSLHNATGVRRWDDPGAALASGLA